MESIKEVIIVEGRYDKNTVSRVVDAVIVETTGFGIFTNCERMELLRRLAEKNGAVILTDSDSAGFVIRNYLKGTLAGVNLKHAYIPDIRGKEKRKSSPSKEGKLGVEGMETSVILEALRRSGATFADGSSTSHHGQITKADLYAAGLSGIPGCAEKRRSLLIQLRLPELLTSNALLDVLNALYTREEFMQIIS